MFKYVFPSFMLALAVIMFVVFLFESIVRLVGLAILGVVEVHVFRHRVHNVR